MPQLGEAGPLNCDEDEECRCATVAEAKNLEKLWLGRCKLVTDMGCGRIAVGGRKLKLLCL